MYNRLLLTIFCSFALVGSALAQSTVSGTVADFRSGDSLPGVNVVINELDRGAATDIEGQYAIENVPEGTYTLTVSYIGYQRYSAEIQVGATDVTHNVELRQDITGLEEVVVTGVGRGTQTTKLGFSVSKISERQLTEVPQSNLGEAIRSKTPGLRIVSASGDPSSPASIRLRGSTSLTGDQQPLIIVDGIITDGSLADINMQDVQSIEVVKGAAAASIYGSLAGNGVIQIITKRAGDNVDRPRVTFRSEYGQSQLARDYPLSDKHPWVMDDIVLDETGQFILEWPGYETFDEDAVWDNEYPVYYDNVDAIFAGQPYNTNYVQIGGTAEAFSYMASYENHRQGGVVEGLPDYNRNSLRLNADYTQTDNFRLSFSGSYTSTDYPFFSEQGQGENYFYSALSAAPFISLLETEADGNFSNNPTGYQIDGSNWQNPLYVAQNRERSVNRDRWIVGATAGYDVTDWFSVFARQSLDTRSQINTDHTPVGYQTPTPSTVLNNGYEFRRSLNVSTAVTELWAESQNSFGDFNASTIFKYLYENRNFDTFTASGYDYAVPGIRRLQATNSDNYSISSLTETERAENFILNTDIDYQEKIILGAMIRRDGSSSFGPDQRWQTYYRGSLAYRLTEDIQIDNVQELKFRASYGTSGQRPPFQAQYETYQATATSIQPNVLGNRNIRPSVVAETEFGMDMAFLDRFNFTANYAITNVTDDYWNVPLTGVSAFSSQWLNIGGIENETFELSLGGQVVQTRNLTLDMNLSFDKTSQTVTDLGALPPFTRQPGGSAIALFRFEEGVSYGAMYGNKLLTSLDQLTVGDDGTVLNVPGGLTVDDFKINSDGRVIVADFEGTEDERPIFLVDETGEKEVTQIGDIEPDFSVGYSANLNWRGLNVFMTLDWTQGGDIYNYSRQLLYNRLVHEDLETYTKDGFHPQYLLAADGLYNGAQATSHFVEDASFVKLREFSVSYTVDSERLGNFGNLFEDVTFSVIGRNLLTFTNYTGFDPEVSLRTNATNFRIDEYSYPNYRTLSGSVRVRI